MAKPTSNAATVTPIQNSNKKQRTPRVLTVLDKAQAIVRKRAQLKKKLAELDASITPEIKPLVEAVEAAEAAEKAKAAKAAETQKKDSK